MSLGPSTLPEDQTVRHAVIGISNTPERVMFIELVDQTKTRRVVLRMDLETEPLRDKIPYFAARWIIEGKLPMLDYEL